MDKKNDFFFQIPSSLEPILKSKYWYTVNEFLNFLRLNRKIFEIEKFRKCYSLFSSEINKRKNKWDFIRSLSLIYNGFDIPIIILKYIYAKCKVIFNNLKIESKKRNIDLETAISSINSQIEKFVYENNIKYIYPQNIYVSLIISFKEIFRDKVKDDNINGQKNGFFQKFNKKKLITQLAKSPFFTGYVQNDIENKEIQEKKIHAIEQLIQKENSLKFYFGKLNTYFKKNNIIVDDDSKLLQGKLFTVYNFDKGDNYNHFGKGLNTLSDMLDLNNSYYFPSDNKKFKYKTLNKLQNNVVKSQTLNKEIIEKINKKYQNQSFNKMIKDSQKNEINIEEVKQNNNNISGFSFFNIINKNKETSTLKDINLFNNKKTSTDCLIPLVQIHKNENENLFPKKRNKNENDKLEEEINNFTSSNKNTSKTYCSKEMIINKIKCNGFDKVKYKFINTKNFKSLNLRERKNKLEEIDYCLHSIIHRRKFVDIEHKNILNIIKKN